MDSKKQHRMKIIKAIGHLSYDPDTLANVLSLQQNMVFSRNDQRLTDHQKKVNGPAFHNIDRVVSLRKRLQEKLASKK